MDFDLLRDLLNATAATRARSASSWRDQAAKAVARSRPRRAPDRPILPPQLTDAGRIEADHNGGYLRTGCGPIPVTERDRTTDPTYDTSPSMRCMSMTRSPRLSSAEQRVLAPFLLCCLLLHKHCIAYGTSGRRQVRAPAHGARQMGSHDGRAVEGRGPPYQIRGLVCCLRPGGPDGNQYLVLVAVLRRVVGPARLPRDVRGYGLAAAADWPAADDYGRGEGLERSRRPRARTWGKRGGA